MDTYIKRPRAAGILRVTQPAGKELIIRDFDASEWSYQWITVQRDYSFILLRVIHDNPSEYSDSFEVAEFSTPVQVERIAEH